jgi:glycosyltransferase involved in cell wall biosynthesis
MKKNPLLTIAIPTFNRSKTLEKILQQLQKEKNKNFVVLVSDDQSPDNTREVVGKYQKNMSNLIYHRNKINLGFSGNVCKLYELATTRYIWFVCDDDTILPAAVDKVITSLLKYEPVVAVFNTKWKNVYGQELIAGVNKDTVYTNINQMGSYQPLMRMTFLSIDIFERRISVEKIKETNYTDNIFFQITLGLKLLDDKFKYCEIACPIIYRNVGYKYGEFFKFYLVDQLKAIFLVKHHFDNSKFIDWSIRHLPIALELYLSQKLGIFKYNGKPTWKTIKLIVKYYGFFSLLIAFFPIVYYLTPTPLLKFLYFIRLKYLHGSKNAISVYNNVINRAYKDERKTGFITYR